MKNPLKTIKFEPLQIVDETPKCYLQSASQILEDENGKRTIAFRNDSIRSDLEELAARTNAKVSTQKSDKGDTVTHFVIGGGVSVTLATGA